MTRNVLILGATSAIASEVCRCLASEHADLFLVGRNNAKLEAIANDLLVRGARAVQVMEAELADYSSHPKIVAEATAGGRHLDAVLIAYGSLPDQTLCERNPEVLSEAMEVNCLSVVGLLSRLAEFFESQRGGVVAVIGSVAGDRGRRSNYVYGCAKAALATFLAGLRLRLAPYGVHVVLIKPGWVDTPMTSHLPKNFLYASPQDVGRRIYRAMLSPRPVVYAPWYWRWIMLVLRLIPAPIFAKLKL